MKRIFRLKYVFNFKNDGAHYSDARIIVLSAILLWNMLALPCKSSFLQQPVVKERFAQTRTCTFYDHEVPLTKEYLISPGVLGLLYTPAGLG